MVVQFDVTGAPVPDEAGPISRLFVYAPLYGVMFAVPAYLVLYMAWAVIAAANPDWSHQNIAQTLAIDENELAKRIYLSLAAIIAVVGAFVLSGEAKRRVPVYGLTMGELNGLLTGLRKRLHLPTPMRRVWGAANALAIAGLWWEADQAGLWGLRDLQSHFGMTSGVALAILCLTLNCARLIFAGASAGRFYGSLAIRALSVFAALAAFVAAVILVTLASSLLFRGGDNDGVIAFTVLGGLVLGGFAAFKAVEWVDARTNLKAAMLGATTAHDKLRVDRRRPVLFLRSFKDDQKLAPTTTEPGNDRNQFMRLETVIVQGAGNVGPVIAVGEPGRIPSGIARAYYQGNDWQEAVTTWMEQALLIIFVAGYTEGVRWEFENAIKRGYARKLIVVFPPKDRYFEARWDWVRHIVGQRAFGPAMDQARRTDAVLICTDSSDNLCVMTSRNPTADDYRAALALAVYGKLVRTA